MEATIYRKLKKVGGSHIIRVSKDVIELLNLKENEMLEIQIKKVTSQK